MKGLRQINLLPRKASHGERVIEDFVERNGWQIPELFQDLRVPSDRIFLEPMKGDQNRAIHGAGRYLKRRDPVAIKIDFRQSFVRCDPECPATFHHARVIHTLHPIYLPPS